jgi:uncharacterized protein YcsI (UPF0317 family)
VQANLVILPTSWAEEFATFCERNPRALPLLDRTAPGSPIPHRLAPGADLRTDLPRYRIYRDGRMIEELADLSEVWHEELVAFLLGCSFTFDAILRAAGIPVRHVECGRNVPMYVANRPTIAVGRLHGPLVVSMRPVRVSQVDRVVALTRRLTSVHGAPLHVGDPAALGINDLARPDFGDPVPIHPGEVPAFWACGVTAQAVAQASRIPLMITHAPGHMFITDWTIERLAEAGR